MELSPKKTSGSTSSVSSDLGLGVEPRFKSVRVVYGHVRTTRVVSGSVIRLDTYSLSTKIHYLYTPIIRHYKVVLDCLIL